MTGSKLSFGFSGNVDTTLKSWVPKLRNLVTRLMAIEEGILLVGQKVTGISIPAGTEVGTEHNLGVVPSGVIITYVNGGIVQHGDTAHTENLFYLKNESSSDDAAVDVMVIS